MVKILHIPNYYFPHIGGIEQTARDIVNSLKDKYEQKVICFNSEKKTVVDKVDNIEVVRVGTFLKLASQSLSKYFGKELKKIMKSFQPNIVIFHYPNPFVAHYLEKYCQNKKFKLILYWHLDITKQKILGKLFKNQNLRLLKYADKIVSTSPNYLEGSPWLLPNKDKCIVIPSCINEERLKYDDSHIAKANDIKRQNDGKKICFAFGRHVEYKGLTYLIKASKLLSNDYVVFIGGSGPLTENLKKEAKDDFKVHFLGRISDDDLKAYLLACDIFCFPSITKNEAFGLGLAEAMYFGKPVVTFNIPGSGVNYVSINGETGIEVENSNYLEYANAIKRCEMFMGENGKKRVTDNFLFIQFSNNVRKLMEEII